MIYAGRTLFLTKGKGHLWVVLTDPDGNPPQVIIVNFTTRRPGCDETVILRRGDHSFVVHDTAVQFRDARLVSTRTLEGLITSGIGIFHDDCSRDLLERIQDGMLDSPAAPGWLKAHCRRVLGL